MGTRVQSLKKQFTNEQLNRFVNFVLRYIADLDIPIKRCVVLCCCYVRDHALY